MKQQVLVIHGGDTFDTYEEYLADLKKEKVNIEGTKGKRWKDTLGQDLGKNFQVIFPKMPNMDNAKYLSENKFPKKIKATFLVAAPFWMKGLKNMPKEFLMPKSLKLFEKQGGDILLYQSKDDSLVSFDDVKKYQKVLPSAHARIFSNKGHFILEKFPEILSEIKEISSK